MACSILFLWVKGTIIGFYQQNWIGKFTGHFNPMNGVSDQPKQSFKKSMWVFHDQKTVFTSEDLLVLNVGNGWVAGVAGMIITSDDWDHSLKFPAKHQQDG